MRSTWIGCTVLAALVVLSIALDGGVWTPLTLVVAAGVLLGLDARERNPARPRGAYLAFVALASAPYVLRLASTIRDNLAEPPEWDFMGFWLHARSAVTGASFYDPHSARALAAAFSFGEEFRREIVETGFWYPPPSMFLFAPLGWFEPPAALALWYALQMGAVALVVVLLARTFLPGGGIAAVFASAALVLACNGTLTTFAFAQTNFIALLALLLFWRGRDAFGGGVWLAVAIVVKPFLAALAVVPLLRPRRRLLAGTCAAAAVLTLASYVAFGRRTFADYLAMNQLAKPDWIFSEAPTQSLLSLILRASGADCGGWSCIANPVFVVCAALAGAITVAVVFGLRKSFPEVALALTVAALLLLYPLTGLSYSVLLIPPLLLVWRMRERLPGGAWTAALFVAAMFALAELHDGTETVFAFAASWLALAGFGVLWLRGREAAPTAAPAGGGAS